MCTIKYKKIQAPVGQKSRLIPLNAASNGQELSELRSIFVLGKSEYHSSLHRLMGVIATSFLGTCNLPCLRLGSPPLGCLCLIHMFYLAYVINKKQTKNSPPCISGVVGQPSGQEYKENGTLYVQGGTTRFTQVAEKMKKMPPCTSRVAKPLGRTNWPRK